MSLLHIHCGDCSADTLRRSGVAGDILVWREIYIEGPAPGGLSFDEWCRTRAQFLTSFGLDFQTALDGITALYRTLAQAGHYDEIVLWFDACMFDQTIMLHVLDELGKLALAHPRLSLICVSHCGLGELPAEAMAALLPARTAVTPAQIACAHDAWAAFTAADPRRIETFLQRDPGALPHVAPALRRHLEQFPAISNGLSRLQHAALDVIDGGAHALVEIFRGVSAREEQAFLGDTSLWACLDGLARGGAPALAIAGPGSIVRPLHDPLTQLDRWRVTLTPAGAQMLRGELDWVRENGIDRWLGGVHLCGPEAAWRWDAAHGCLVCVVPASAV